MGQSLPFESFGQRYSAVPTKLWLPDVRAGRAVADVG